MPATILDIDPLQWQQICSTPTFICCHSSLHEILMHRSHDEIFRGYLQHVFAERPYRLGHFDEVNTTSNNFNAKSIYGPLIVWSCIPLVLSCKALNRAVLELPEMPSARVRPDGVLTILLSSKYYISISLKENMDSALILSPQAPPKRKRGIAGMVWCTTQEAIDEPRLKYYTKIQMIPLCNSMNESPTTRLKLRARVSNDHMASGVSFMTLPTDDPANRYNVPFPTTQAIVTQATCNIQGMTFGGRATPETHFTFEDTWLDSSADDNEAPSIGLLYRPDPMFVNPIIMEHVLSKTTEWVKADHHEFPMMIQPTLDTTKFKQTETDHIHGNFLHLFHEEMMTGSFRHFRAEPY